MTIPKKYFQDRLVVLLLSINILLTIIGSLSILFHISGQHSQVYIAEYRSNLGLSAYRPGSVTTFVAFAAFMVLVLVFHTLLSIRVYRLHRQFALAVLAMGLMLIVLAAVVSNSLLGLR